MPTGCGFIEIAHGRCSFPAPATAELLAGVPLAPSPVEAELTTPTGAAILAALVSEFGPPPAMTIRADWLRRGQRDLAEQPNLLRVLVGEAAETATALDDVEADTVWVLETNLDDTTGEAIGYCIEQLWQAGALDVYTTAIQMKKNRPGVTLTVLCPASDVAALERIIFRETTTLGVRRWASQRHKLARRTATVETPWGKIAGSMGDVWRERTAFRPNSSPAGRLPSRMAFPFQEVFDSAVRSFPSRVSLRLRLKKSHGSGKNYLQAPLSVPFIL